MNYDQRLRNAAGFGDIFELVKKIVFEFARRDQAGLMLGVTDLGGQGNAFIGAFYTMQGNMIIINKRPLQRIQETSPQLYNPYIFHVLLHEYIHSLGITDEAMCRQLTYEISKEYFGEENIVTQFAQNMEKFIPNLVYPQNAELPENPNIEFIKGFDKGNTDYIL
jgi:hypothetical protein